MKSYPIDVSASGAVHLGSSIVCDGFVYGAPVRVQTHIHEDHMDGFDSSKGFQDILMSEATRSLLIAERDADLPLRENFLGLRLCTPFPCCGETIELCPSGHMLGAVQVVVEGADGRRFGYSGDFSWPCEHVIEVDALVVDSTYGSPDFCREYDQRHVEDRFLDLCFSLLKKGPIDLIAHRGTLQRAVQILSGAIADPIVASSSVVTEIDIYRAHGYCLDHVVRVDTPEGREIARSSRHLRLYGKGDKKPIDRPQGSRVVLSAFMTNTKDPVLEYSEASFRVAMSDHADFPGTLEYVKATGAQYVVTDNTRAGHAVLLAQEIQRRLGIRARPSANRPSNDWGV